MYCRIRKTPNAVTRFGRDHGLEAVEPAEVDHLDVERDQRRAAPARATSRARAGTGPCARGTRASRTRSPASALKKTTITVTRRCDDRGVDERLPEVDVHDARVEEAADVVEQVRARQQLRRIRVDGRVRVRRDDERPVEREERQRRRRRSGRGTSAGRRCRSAARPRRRRRRRRGIAEDTRPSTSPPT